MDEAPHATAVERTRWTTVATSALATLMVAGELSMAAFALPLIGAELGVTSATTAWVLLAYQLPLAALVLPTGRWVDRADLRLVFMISLSCIAAAGVLAGLAPAFWVLMVARVLQGAAAALYMAVYLPVISSSVRADQHGRAMSYHATIMMVGSMAVAPLGGWVAEALGWRAVFLVKVPLLLPMTALGAITFPRLHATGRRLPRPGRWLTLEVLLIGGAVTALLLAGEQTGQSPPLAAGLIVTATALAAGWARLPASRPVIALARRPAFAFPALALMLNAATIGLVTFLLPFYLTDVLDGSLEMLGAAIVFLVAAGAVVSPLAGMLADRYGPVPVARTGGALTVAAMLPMLTLEAGDGLIDLGWRLALLGAGMALFNSPNMTAILRATPGEAGTAGGLTNITRTLGSTLGPAAAALAWSAAGGGVSGFRGGVTALTALTVVALVALCAMRTGHLPLRERRPPSRPRSRGNSK